MASLNLMCKGRSAAYTPNKHAAAALDIPYGTDIPVVVLGLFQVACEDDTDAYFVIELADGTCRYAAVTEIRFIKEDNA